MENKPPQAVIDRLEKLKADGILQDPAVVETIKEAFAEISELRQEQGMQPGMDDLKRIAALLTQELGKPVSVIDVAAALQHYGSQPNSGEQTDAGAE